MKRTHGWHDLEADLDRLLALDADARIVALRALADADAPRAARLQRWLADIEHSEGMLESRPPPPRALPPDAPWRLLRPLDSGGMGEVWLAERADGAFARRVAIKFLRVDRAALGDRLVRERELLARLRHPGIAMLLDGGVTTSGEPYLVTEWVDGERMDAWVRVARPDLRARVQALRRIAEAVSYAHANLIVHRDLKPANVMIDREGMPRLLDFGIARLLGEAGGSTLTQDRALTPAFASPEQLLGHPITTRSDIYALGGLLYWLICGRPPHDAESLPLAELIKRVCEHDVPAPSTRSDAAPMSGAGDLDAIALKALARDPAERYATADALARDLGRWLDGDSVSARLPTRIERLARLVRRHRAATALTLATLLALIAGIVGTTWQARESARQRDAALQEADRGEQLLDTFARLFREAEDEERLSASEWLDRAVHAQDDQAATDPGARLRMLVVLAGIEQDRGQAARAMTLLERVLQEERGALSAAERAAARCRLGSAYGALGRSDQAQATIALGLAEAETLVGAERLALVDCLRSRAAAGLAGDRPGDEHIAAARREILEIDRLSQTRDLRWRRAGALYALGTLLDVSGRHDEAAQAYAQVSRMDEELGNLETLDHAAVITAQAGALNLAGRPRDADARYAEGIALAQRIGGRTPNLATDLVNHAMIKNQLDDAAAAVALAQRAIDLFDELRGANPIGNANAYLELGKGLTRLQRFPEARAALDEAAARMRAIPGAERRVTPIEIWNARLALARGERDDARRRIDPLLAMLRASQDAARLADALQVAARIALAGGDAMAAESLAREAITALQQGAPVQPQATARAELTLAEVLAARSGADTESRELAGRARRVLETALGPDHPLVLTAAELAGP